MPLNYRHAARTLVGELVRAGQITARRPEAVDRELASWCEDLGRPPTGRELEAWFEDQAGVTEVFATAALLESVAARLLTPMPEPTPELVPVTAISETDAQHPELERGIHEALDSADQYLVYADWLQEQGDPFGELVVLGVAATTTDTDEDRARFHLYLASHVERILGPNARELNECFGLIWRYGFVHSVICSAREPPPTHRQWEQLLTLRACELVRWIRLHQFTSAVDGVIDLATPHLETLVVVDCEGLPKRLAGRELQSLELHGGTARLGPSSLSPSLHRLVLIGCQVEVSELARLDIRELQAFIDPASQALFASVLLPRLVRLHLLNVDAQLSAMLERAVMPALQHLALEGVVTGATLCSLAKLPLASQLRSLTIGRLVLRDADLLALAAHPENLTGLGVLDVSGNELTADGLAAAARLAARVFSAHQSSPGSHIRTQLIEFAGDRLGIAEELLDSANWTAGGIDRTVRWARYRGSSGEYELFVTADLERYSCTCASRYFPCKHVVALALRGNRGDLTEAPSNGLAHLDG